MAVSEMDKSRFVTGHDFSRAANACKINWASAPAVPFACHFDRFYAMEAASLIRAYDSSGSRKMRQKATKAFSRTT
jgi:hypothetical protein